ncbi:hypothetical protein [Nocardioides sp.]|uniref:hypothetical protein n=1 Tax=Nocardioides sp. TaxID=35761 RepID=UPI000C925473|nr:hypothetical protein [Nocardioides sp.]MAS55567.1 hypothetical protein [Pimelobacter sp.]MDE0777637.1 hypothetical protein [Nocardioides sp.]
MLLALIFGGLVGALTLATVASRPATDRSRERTSDRREKFVARNPTHVNSADIVASLRRAGVEAGQARFITDRAHEQGIKPFTLWLWLEQFGAEALSIVVAADLTHRELLTHISNGTMPDLEELKLFASANGLDVTEPVVPAATSSTPSVKAKKRPPMPPIFDPGTYPGLEVPTRRRVNLGDNVQRDGGTGDAAAA